MPQIEAETKTDLVTEVEELLANRIAILFSTDGERGFIDLLSRLKNEVARLRSEIRDYEQTNLVPRSRYDAANADFLEMKQQVQDVARRATVEIQRLESENAALVEEVKALRAHVADLNHDMEASNQHCEEYHEVRTRH